MRKAIIIIHNETGKSDVFYGFAGDDLWHVLRDMHGKHLEHMTDLEVNILERITSKDLGFYKIDRFIRVNKETDGDNIDLSIFQIWDYVKND